jgi:LysR family transcriptional regulator for bpeEF and oprC
MDRLRTLALFKAVAEMGSFINAADAMGVSASVVSRAVADFESALGVRLFERTTRHVALTAEGHVALEQALAVLEAYDELMASGRNGATEVSGEMRLTAPPSFVRAVAPAVAGFLAQHPKVRVDLQLRDAPADLVQEGIDVALRIAWDLPDTLIARRIGSAPLGLFAAPSYLAQRGVPVHPTDIADHDCLRYNGFGKSIPWTLEHPATGERIVPNVAGKLVTNSGEALLSAAVHGAGLAVLPWYIAAPAVAEGALQPLLAEWTSPDLEFFLTYSSRRNQPRRVRALIDWLAAYFETTPLEPGR